jgi:dihydrofolate synthase/folylpolyglutamate synthase
MITNAYDDTINWLFAQFPSYQNIGAPAYKPGLENVEKLCSVFDNPQHKLKFIHLAGSNGKGSTASMLASYLTENKLKTGLFTSPHLVDFRERIRINGEVISEEKVIDFCSKIQQLDFEPSFFEISFVMALVHFTAANCDLCVIETGLGGRLDATNIITPLLSIITTISLEHTNFLGNTIEEIAFEKAGIIKNSVPVIIGSKHLLTAPVFEKKAEGMHAEIIFADNVDITIPADFPLLGDYQKQNFKTAFLAGEILQKNFSLNSVLWEKALKNISRNTGFQGRMQVVSMQPRIIFDVSHNTEGIEATLKFLDKEMETGDLFIVYGSSADKNFDEIFPLFPSKATYFFTEFENMRSAKEKVLSDQAKKRDLNFLTYVNANQALEMARTKAKPQDTILVFGSFFLLHDFLK